MAYPQVTDSVNDKYSHELHFASFFPSFTTLVLSFQNTPPLLPLPRPPSVFEYPLFALTFASCSFSSLGLDEAWWY